MTTSAAAATSPAELLGARRRRAPRRRLIALAVAAALAVAGWLVARRLVGGGDAAPGYATQPAAHGDVVARVTATGILSPVVQVEVGSQVSGRIAELRADYNSEVHRGDVLAIIDPQAAQTAVAQARARLTSARADHTRARAVAANAKLQYQRMATLAERGAVARAEADSALAEHRSADASVAAAAAAITVARAALEEAEVNLDYTTIRSPIDGTVISRNVDVGQTVAASLSAPVLFVIAEEMRKMEVHTSVAESDVGRLRQGTAVEFTVDAFPDRTFRGEVKQIRYEAATVSNVVTYDAVVAVANDELLLRPGMTANATFIVEARRDVLAVPQKALAYRPADAGDRLAALRGGGRSRGERPANAALIWVLRDGQPTPVRVVKGLSDGILTEIVSGELADGDQVITADGSGAGGAAQPAGGQRRRRGPPRVL
jgi:HlyD family secretion protein